MQDHGLWAETNRLAEELRKLNERLAASETTDSTALSIGIPGVAPAAARDLRGARSIRPALPDSRLVRRILRNRQARTKHFDAHLFADPAWDMLLDLTAARAEHRRVSVTSLCIASGVPPTTALRWIGQMVVDGQFVRVGDQADRRRAFIELSDRCAAAMASYFDETGMDTYR